MAATKITPRISGCRMATAAARHPLMWVATKTPASRTVISANADFDKCLAAAEKKGVKRPCVMLLPVSH